jgi:hypothetical protein
VAGGCIVTSWNMTCVTFHSILTRSAGGLFDCLLDHFYFDYDKKEGGCNSAFDFVADNAKRAVARHPLVLAGPASLTTNSKVATIKYLTFEPKYSMENSVMTETSCMFSKR